MKVVADENMPGLARLAEQVDLQSLPGRRIRAADVADADAVLVRSVTRVGADLLAHSAVRFVGSATIGTDHVDRDWLASRGIAFAHAPGCNARAVAEYVLQVVLAHGPAPLAGASAAVIGVGNVGRQVVQLLAALGMTVLAVDPPLARQGAVSPVGRWSTLEDALAADVISLHVPLTAEGDDVEAPTRHLLDADRLAQLGSHQLLVNTCRGAVIDGVALARRLAAGSAPSVVLDVWEGEPRINAGLARRVTLGSPHVAGYSVQGKYRGSAMVVAALADALGLSVPAMALPFEPFRHEAAVDSASTLLAFLRARHDIRTDHQRLLDSLGSDDPARAFDDLRRHYPARHECEGGSVADSQGRWREVLSLLGVRSP